MMRVNGTMLFNKLLLNIIYLYLTAKSPYSSSQIKGSPKQQVPKPAARNMWITAMRNGTASKSSLHVVYLLSY